MSRLKENIIMGHLIPAGTGFSEHRNISIVKHVFEESKKKESEKEGSAKEAEVK